MNLQGCHTAIITPFKDGQIDYQAMGNLIETGTAAAKP